MQATCLDIIYKSSQNVCFSNTYLKCGFPSRAKTVNENLKMSSPLLSRFDLVFILLDRPDEHMDKRLSEHIMAVSNFTPEQSFFTYALLMLYLSDLWFM